MKELLQQEGKTGVYVPDVKLVSVGAPSGLPPPGVLCPMCTKVAVHQTEAVAARAGVQEYSTRRVLVSEWIDGVKLSDCSPEEIRELIPLAQEVFLTQLLQVG